MIRIIVQRKKSSSIFKYKEITTLKKLLNLNWFNAIKLAYKLSKGYGIVITTPTVSKQQYMYAYMDDLHYRLNRVFDTSWKQDLETVATQIPLNDFNLFKIGGGYRVYTATTPGWIDHFLKIYP